MKFRIRFAQQIVGLFVILAGVSVLGVVVSMGASQRWFARNYAYYSVFPSAEGLSNGMSITFKGFDIGRVIGISLADTDEVRVDFTITDTFHERVVANSILELVTSPIGLGGGLVFHQGRSLGEPLPEGSLIPAINSKEGQEIATAGNALIPASGDSITRIIGQVEPVLRNVNTLLISVDRTLGNVNAALEGDTDMPLGETLARVNTLLEEVEVTLVQARAETAILLAGANGLIDSTAGVITSTAGIAANLEATTAELRDPTGLVPRLLDADGSISTFLDDNNALYDQVESILTSIGATLDEVNGFAGFINGTQPQISGLLAESRETITVTQDVLEGLRNNPLLRGGIAEEVPQPTTFQSFRDAQF